MKHSDLMWSLNRLKAEAEKLNTDRRLSIPSLRDLQTQMHLVIEVLKEKQERTQAQIESKQKEQA